jgi:hypothetical protein
MHVDARKRRHADKLTNSALKALSWLHDSPGVEQSPPLSLQRPDDLQRQLQSYVGSQCRQCVSELGDISCAGGSDASLKAMLKGRSLYGVGGSGNLAGFVASRAAAPTSSEGSPELLQVGPSDVRRYLEDPAEAMLARESPEMGDDVGCYLGPGFGPLPSKIP